MAVTPADQDQAFLREVDENLRRDQIADLSRRYGKIAIGVIVAALVALAGYLWWHHHRETVAGEQGEQLQAAFDNLGSTNVAAAQKPLADLSGSRIDGYRVAAILSQAAVALDRKDTKTAAAKFASVANDASLAKPYRDLALVKQTMIEFDGLTPQAVIDRLKPLAVAGGAFLGTAGEMVALSDLKLGRRAQAGALFGLIARTETVPDTIRQRAVQMAGVLGVDAVDQGEGGNKQ